MNYLLVVLFFVCGYQQEISRDYDTEKQCESVKREVVNTIKMQGGKVIEAYCHRK
jgi:hypothetical protein